MDFKEFTVQDRLGPLTVRGELLADRRFGADRKPRWTDLALYQVTTTVQDWRVTVACEGCQPARTLVVNAGTLSEAPIICGQCDKPFTPDERQREKPFRYALEIIARSWVYHRVPGPCVKKRHMITTVGEVEKSNERWRNLLACRTCTPVDLVDMNDNDRIAEERQDSHVYLCSDAITIVNRLYRHSGEISPLAAGLLREAAMKDPEIAAAVKSTRRI